MTSLGFLGCLFVYLIKPKLGTEEGGCQEMPQKQKKVSQLKPASSTQRIRKGATKQDRKLENAALLQTPPTPAKPEWEDWTPRQTETWFPNTPMDVASEKKDFIPTGAQCGDHVGILDFYPHPGVSLFLFPLGWW